MRAILDMVMARRALRLMAAALPGSVAPLRCDEKRFELVDKDAKGRPFPWFSMVFGRERPYYRLIRRL